jgi:2-polyprenyl-3-methyl-5-hydroxy-6-metoxy-1,4-benzoquinol methylase
MDIKTIHVYNLESSTYFSKYSKSKEGTSKYFHIAFPLKSSILEIGTGSGKDLHLLHQYGHNVIGIEPSEELIKLSLRKYPSLTGKIFNDNLPDLGGIKGTFDAILCSAVLMHIPQMQLFDSAVAIKNHLNVGGRILLSIPHFYPGINKNSLRDNNGRLFNGITANQLILLFERLGFRLIERWEDKPSDYGSDVVWNSILMKLESGNSIKPIDSIEAIMNKDLKVATYKLALFRALAEIATTNSKAVYWQPNGKVLLPIDLIIEKWIEYYWAIFESEDFIPQIQKENQNSVKPVAFRQALSKLIDQYKHSGGAEGYHVDTMRNKLQTMSIKDYGDAFRIIKSTLINGPIKHAGGYNTVNKLFQYEKNGFIVIPDLIWRELTILGSWIIDACILRWAELTSKFSDGKIKPSKVIDLLLINEKSRQIADAKRIYKENEIIKCVWTSEDLKEFDIDHIIPFSLWKNNDLWNLVPAKPSVNRNKKDKIITNDLLIKVKDNIVDSWKLIYEKEEVRFLNEAKILVGNSINRKNWENMVFAGLKEAIECTAIQRGIERWEPN